MPELPEIETICNTLRSGGEEFPSILGKTITNLHVLWDRSIAIPDAESFKSRIVNQQIEEINRRGKYLHLRLSNDSLIIHLRMSGDIFIEPFDKELADHHRVLFFLDDGWRIAFNDTRKFGRIWLVKDPDQVFNQLGPEPLDSDFTPGIFFQRLTSYHRQIKPLIMDQSFIAGIGNIYADEALHLAGLHPLTKSNEINAEQGKKLWKSIRQVLLDGIHHNGASIDWIYRGGEFQNYFRVYGRTGEPCPVCGSGIEKTVVGQRGTHFCPQCQPYFSPSM